MGSAAQAAVFGKRKEPHTVIIACGDEIRHFTVRPWAATMLCSTVALAAVGYLLATSYLVFRDDLISGAVARQARMQQDYEDRISALRAQVDRITSRQMLDQQIVEGKVTELMARQGRLSTFRERLGGAEAPTEALPATAPAPQIKPGLAAAEAAFAPARSAADRADLAFIAINDSLRDVEAEQGARVDALSEQTYRAAGSIADALESVGVEGQVQDGTGGPLIPVDPATSFDAKLAELDAAMDRLDSLRREARALPLANPAPERAVSSTFGVRKDPLLGTPAMHAGIDFRAPSGSAAAVTAAGKVVKAGWAGGYGQMVEVDHGGGLTTRYAHLSRIDVEEGQHVEAGQTVGEVGSTGRSTGPHLHYEVREHGTAVDPLRFLKAGKKIAGLL